MITVRAPEDIYRAGGEVSGGTFLGRWHFSFGGYLDRARMGFGTLRVFNDDTLSPGAVWPLHPHRDIEVVTYCAEGEFRHADEKGAGGVLKKGGVQHTTVGRGLWHSEINNRDDAPMRFIQMWFTPEANGLAPSVEQKAVEKKDRAGRLLEIVSPLGGPALRIRSDAYVYSSFLKKGGRLEHALEAGRGAYVYIIEGAGASVNGLECARYGAAMAKDEDLIGIEAIGDSELLLVDVGL